jgi:FKBP-type peptidyl-prolyl cis-trans isomerase
MKYQIKQYVLAVSLCALIFWGCNKDENTADSPASGENVFDADTSYAIGMDFAMNLRENDYIPDIDAFSRGFRDAITGGETRFSRDEAGTKIQQAIMSRIEKENEKYKQSEIDFLAENSKKSGIIITNSGLQYEVIAEGSGAKPAAMDTVRVDYEGTLIDGSVFDSSYARGEPTEFPLNGVIPGWIEGLQLMSVGSKYRFYIPSELAYGSQGGGPIPPYAALIFNVELLDIVK